MVTQAMYDDLVEGLHEAIGYAEGKRRLKTHQVQIPQEIDVRGIREQLHLSREAFAREFGVSARTLQHWEQGDRQPHGPARVLLLLLQRAPEVVSTILKGA